MFNRLFDDRDAFVGHMQKNDSQELRDRVLVTDKLRVWYCGYVRDLRSVWSKITDSEYAFWYCSKIKDRKKVWSNITDEGWANLYCKYVKNRPEVRKYV